MLKFCAGRVSGVQCNAGEYVHRQSLLTAVQERQKKCLQEDNGCSIIKNKWLQDNIHSPRVLGNKHGM